MAMRPTTTSQLADRQEMVWSLPFFRNDAGEWFLGYGNDFRVACVLHVASLPQGNCSRVIGYLRVKCLHRMKWAQ